GTGFRSTGVIKTGVGTLAYGGTAANTYTGVTTVNEGTLALAKPDGVNAFSGTLTIGDGNLPPTGTGGQNSDVVQLRQNNQIPDALTPVTINSTGLLDLNGFSETIGNANLQTTLTLAGGAGVSTGAGTLTLGGDINFTGGVIA